MAPTGPRSRTNPPSRAPPPNSSVRNEVFENIFGRPAGGHHLGSGPAHQTPPPPPPPQQHPIPPPLPQASYGYGGYGTLPQSNGGYVNAAQPSFPPPQVGVGYAVAAPPPRGASAGYAQGATHGYVDPGSFAPRAGYESGNGQFGRGPVPQQAYSGGSLRPQVS
jgi:hypothetical protein